MIRMPAPLLALMIKMIDNSLADVAGQGFALKKFDPLGVLISTTVKDEYDYFVFIEDNF